MDLGLHGRVALVSGASAGLGRAIAATLVAEGARVAISSRSEERIARTAAEIGATGLVWDTDDVDAAPALVAEVAARFGAPVELLVVNTGGPPPGSDPLGFAREQWEAAYRSLVLAPVALIEAAVPGMREQGYGRIVTVASYAVREPIPELLLSSSHRAALVAAFKTIAQAVAGDAITLNTLLPGAFATDRVLRRGESMEAVRERYAASVPVGRIGEPAELAAAAAFLCSTHAAYITGETLCVDGGLTRSIF